MLGKCISPTQFIGAIETLVNGMEAAIRGVMARTMTP